MPIPPFLWLKTQSHPLTPMNRRKRQFPQINITYSHSKVSGHSTLNLLLLKCLGKSHGNCNGWGVFSADFWEDQLVSRWAIGRLRGREIPPSNQSLFLYPPTSLTPSLSLSLFLSPSLTSHANYPIQELRPLSLSLSRSLSLSPSLSLLLLQLVSVICKFVDIVCFITPQTIYQSIYLKAKLF